MAILFFIVMSLLTGLAYPLATTAVANLFLPEQAKGGLIESKGVIIGAGNIGQAFVSPRYFWGRPSETPDMPYNAAASSGSNLSPANPKLLRTMEERIAFLKRAHGDGPVPVELATASASGLDPHISPAAAFYQVERVAKANGLETAVVAKLVAAHVEGRQYLFFGEPRVNVLQLNLDLSEMETGAL